LWIVLTGDAVRPAGIRLGPGLLLIPGADRGTARPGRCFDRLQHGTYSAREIEEGMTTMLSGCEAPLYSTLDGRVDDRLILLGGCRDRLGIQRCHLHGPLESNRTASATRSIEG
jgi:hypothetical protein